MKTINCAIIEDEPLGAKTLESLLKQYAPEFNVIRRATTLLEAAEVFGDKNIHLFFSDIELLDGSVFNVLKNIQLNKDQYIIFTTAYEEFGAKAFTYPALHYLLKPINPRELEKAIGRYRAAAGGNFKEEESSQGLEFAISKLALPTQSGMLFLDYEEVIRIQSSNKYSIVFATNGKQHIVSRALSKFEEGLSKKGFLRVHDSHIINLQHIKGYVRGKGGEVVMIDSSHIPVSVRRKETLAAILKYPL